jgi:hypothetical protein
VTDDADTDVACLCDDMSKSIFEVLRTCDKVRPSDDLGPVFRRAVEEAATPERMAAIEAELKRHIEAGGTIEEAVLEALTAHVERYNNGFRISDHVNIEITSSTVCCASHEAKPEDHRELREALPVVDEALECEECDGTGLKARYEGGDALDCYYCDGKGTVEP